MTIDTISYRLATADDQSFIDDMNVVATFANLIPESDLPSAESIFSIHPKVGEYSQNFGRPGDIGLIALGSNYRPVGAIWGRDYVRNMTDGAMEPYPFEITMAVREAARHQGIGRQLLDSFAVAAWVQGRDELSLGVHIKNPSARRLYESAGYTPIVDDNGKEMRVSKDYTPMLRQLDFGLSVLRGKSLMTGELRSDTTNELR